MGWAAGRTGESEGTGELAGSTYGRVTDKVIKTHCYRRHEVQLPTATQQRVMTNILKHS